MRENMITTTATATPLARLGRALVPLCLGCLALGTGSASGDIA